jgi:hypothetical protein
MLQDARRRDTASGTTEQRTSVCELAADAEDVALSIGGDARADPDVWHPMELHARHMGQCSGMPPDAAWAEADELRVAERSTFESNIHVRPEEAAERGVRRCRCT